MAFPTIEAWNTSKEDAAVTSHTINLPSGIVSGSLVEIYFTDKDTDGGASPSATGWTIPTNGEAIQAGGASARHTLLYRKCDGAEGATVTITTDTATRSTHVTARYAGHADPDTTPPVCDKASGANGAPDGPNLAPAGGADDILWTAGGGASHGGDYTAPPTNYTLDVAAEIANNSTQGTRTATAVAYRALNASSEDPGAFTYDQSGVSEWAALTVAHYPAAGGGEPEPVRLLGTLGVGA